MCGIAGFVDFRAPLDPLATGRIIATMTATLAERGPDGQGVWTDAAAGVALGHRRLAIIDVSPAGHQPMESACGGYVITYNGELYNADEVRAELVGRGIAFRGHSDTEVLVNACAVWGVEQAARRCHGMFAFALWDRTRRRLSLVRDRIGIKPLYWGLFGSLLLFGSTPRCLAAHPDWRGEIDRDAVAGCLAFSYIPAPRSIWRGLAKLQPGHVVTIEADGTAAEACYWDLRRIALDGAAAPLVLDDAQAVEALVRLLDDAVRRHLVSDVPLGAFLSGGIDSSVMVALMQAASSRPVRTFTIGFEQKDHDEAGHAAAVARHLGTRHTTLSVTARDVLDAVPLMAEQFDEPFADASQIPTYLVSRLARRDVTVCLAGDGGDELFAGYSRYDLTRRLHGGCALMPRPLRRLLAAALTSVSPAAWDHLLAAWRPAFPGDRLHKLATVLEFSGRLDLYRRVIGSWREPGRAVPGCDGVAPAVWHDADIEAMPELVGSLQLVDLLTYLPDGILTKLDRASMAVGLEGRVPLLDHRLVEFAARLPRSLKRRNGVGKWLLRQVLYRHVPPALVERPKMGFMPPTGAWLRGPLRDWAEDLLAPAALAEDDLFDPAPIRQRWAEHLSGRRNWQFSLWEVLMVQAWRRRWMHERPRALCTPLPLAGEGGAREAGG